MSGSPCLQRSRPVPKQPGLTLAKATRHPLHNSLTCHLQTQTTTLQTVRQLSSTDPFCIWRAQTAVKDMQHKLIPTSLLIPHPGTHHAVVLVVPAHTPW